MAKKNDDGPVIETETALQFDPLEVQLLSFYNELSTISNKKPDNILNKFKLKYINQTLEKVNKVLGDEYLPFADFRLFSEDELPTASDVVMMLAQYLRCMNRFYDDHTYHNSDDHSQYWRTQQRNEVEARRTKHRLVRMN